MEKEPSQSVREEIRNFRKGSDSRDRHFLRTKAQKMLWNLGVTPWVVWECVPTPETKHEQCSRCYTRCFKSITPNTLPLTEALRAGPVFVLMVPGPHSDNIK